MRNRPPLTRRQIAARKAQAARAAQASALITRGCSNCRHEVMHITTTPMPKGEVYEIHVPMCGHGGTLVHTHLLRSARGACGPMGALFEPKEKP